MASRDVVDSKRFVFQSSDKKVVTYISPRNKISTYVTPKTKQSHTSPIRKKPLSQPPPSPPVVNKYPQPSPSVVNKFPQPSPSVVNKFPPPSPPVVNKLPPPTLERHTNVVTPRTELTSPRRIIVVRSKKHPQVNGDVDGSEGVTDQDLVNIPAKNTNGNKAIYFIRRSIIPNGHQTSTHQFNNE
ncbi:unnamed protein product [Adineta steineri]|uniref:Uncharacterized protein n=1 Tax=Adineta steineri TaxID=433720 RepID=A0A815KFI6_9BILA|nr:unnamed protein product [Adineta steineri]CAF1392209.1 unnamed protein product [Adineta steineri]CAF3543653.1 unnamed protein product [Adineta steineri]CAF4038687.1 unnamed protein product [Adineta steineri]